jgi:hypothetical protein
MIARLRHWLRGQIWHRSWFMALPLARRYRQVFGYWPNPLTPRCFNEKLFIRMAFDRRPILTVMAGKLEARNLVAARLGRTDRQARLLGVARGVEDLAGLDLPERYIAKASHASGLVRIVTPEQPITAGELAGLARDWLAVDYGRYGLEWQYHGVLRAVVFEELLDHRGGVPDDVKLFCFDGRVVYVQIDGDRFVNHGQSLFDRDWNRLAVQVKDYAPPAQEPARPALLDAMIAEAERLSAGIDFVRVDLFDLGERFLVGELTGTPQGGYGTFQPAWWDAEFGTHWTLPSWWKLRQSYTCPR